VESVLKSITKSANLDRVLFSPALKKIYFDMAVASGGATQFKHAENARKGLSFAADKADDKKSVLLFCAAHELMNCYDLLIEIAAQMSPVVVLALRSGLPEKGEEIWSYMHLRETGWIQFLTHTLQETYDHLALAYHMNIVKKTRLPILILQSSLKHHSLGEVVPREDLDMGNPLTGLQSSRADKKMSFEEAMAKMKHKEEKPSLRKSYESIVPTLREMYTVLGYSLPEQGLPYAGEIPASDAAILSLIPPASPDDAHRVIRPFCYRPFANQSLIVALKDKKKIAVVEPQPAPGSLPTFHAEICAQFGSDFKGVVQSVTFPTTVTSLDSDDFAEIEKRMG
jgi:hypothetical protein